MNPKLVNNSNIIKMSTLMKRILKDGNCKHIVGDGNRIELKLSDISRQKVGELSSKEYGNLIMRLKHNNKLSVRSVEYVKIARQKEKNRLSSEKFNDKEKRQEDKRNEEIRELRRHKNDLEKEKMELIREIAGYEHHIIQHGWNYMCTS